LIKDIRKFFIKKTNSLLKMLENPFLKKALCLKKLKYLLDTFLTH